MKTLLNLLETIVVIPFAIIFGALAMPLVVIMEIWEEDYDKKN